MKKEPMTPARAVATMEQLKYFPKGEAALRDIMQTIDKYLKTGDEIEQLIAKMKTVDEWPGPATFEAECRSIARMTADGSLPLYVSPAPQAISCPTCGDWGHVQRGGVYERCTCHAGYELDEEFLQQLNGRVNRIPGSPRQIARASEILEFQKTLKRVLGEFD